MNKKEIIIISIIATIIIVLLILLINNRASLSFNQPNDYINKGNSYFEEGDYLNYNQALIQYSAAGMKDSTNTGALYNTANTMYRMGNYSMIEDVYKDAVRSTLKIDAPQDAKDLVADIFHNKGNVNMKQVTPLDSILTANEMIQEAEKQGRDVNSVKQQYYYKWQKDVKKVGNSIKDYKESLRTNPSNDSTRFNLAMAQDYEKRVNEILLAMNPPSQNNQNQNQNQNQEDKKDDKKDQQQQQQQDQQQNQQDQKQQQQEQQDQMSKENAEQILKALEEDEKENMKKIKVEKKGKVNIEKDW